MVHGESNNNSASFPHNKWLSCILKEVAFCLHDSQEELDLNELVNSKFSIGPTSKRISE